VRRRSVDDGKDHGTTGDDPSDLFQRRASEVRGEAWQEGTDELENSDCDDDHGVVEGTRLCGLIAPIDQSQRDQHVTHPSQRCEWVHGQRVSAAPKDATEA
jgi:hypothetical protein